WYQLRIVRNAWREVLAETADQAHELGDLLGDHHDLAVLRDRLERAGGANGNLEAIRSAIERRQAELLADALPYATRLYAEKPKAFGRRLHLDVLGHPRDARSQRADSAHVQLHAYARPRGAVERLDRERVEKRVHLHPDPGRALGSVRVDRALDLVQDSLLQVERSDEHL